MDLTDINKRINSIIDQDPSSFSEGDDTWTLRSKLVNMAQQEWGELYDWQTLYKEYNTRITTSSNNASLSMPADFRKLASFPKITYDGVSTEEFPEVRPQNKGQFLGTDNYVSMYGNPANGYTMYIHGETLASGASVFAPYYASPASLVSGCDVSMCPNADFLVQRTLAYIYESNSDPRFPNAKLEAEKILQRLLERESVHSEASYSDRVRTVEQTRHGYRIGRDN